MSFPPQNQLKIKFLDSYILPEFIPDLISVFTTLGLDPSMLTTWSFDYLGNSQPLWERVLDALRGHLESLPSALLASSR